MAEPAVLPQIAQLSPYKPGMSIEALAQVYGLDQDTIIKLASNENPYGMSPHAQAAASQAAADASRYPDGTVLRQALARIYGVDEATIVLGNGSNDVLDLIAHIFLGPGDESISSQHAFIVYRLATAITGAQNVIVPARGYGHDLQAMRAAITDATKAVWIANPNNPTGTFIAYDELATWLADIPAHITVVLDEAYYEYLDPADRAVSIAWLARYPNLIIVRTFSKAYGLAGLRVGYAITSPVIADMLSRVRQPFNVSYVGIMAATAALADQSFVADSYERNRKGLLQMKAGLDKLGLIYLPAYGNFVTVGFNDAGSMHEALLRQGIIIRPLTEYGMPDHLRISVGTPQENDQLLGALSRMLPALNANA